MPALKNLINKRFGRLVVIERAPNQGRYVCWKCQCDCGEQCIIKADSLSSGKTQSCGCLYKETRPKPKNLIGQRFGKLRVLSLLPERKNRRVMWKCQCDCGGMTIASTHDLNNGSRVSCGCKGKSAGETIIESILIENQIKFKTEYKFNDLFTSYNNKAKFDFALLDDNNNVIRLIEYDGEQHFRESDFFKGSLKQRQKYDNIKNQYAKEHNIPLIRIPYWEIKNINLEMLIGDKYLIKE